MAKDLTDKIYSDRPINCKCGEHIADVRADAQILVLTNGLIAFGFLAYQCNSCGHNGRFLSPNLPDTPNDIDNHFPDTKMLEQKTKGITKLAFDRYRVRIRAGGKEKYIGVYPTESEAVKFRDKALAESLGYLPKTLTELHQD